MQQPMTIRDLSRSTDGKCPHCGSGKLDLRIGLADYYTTRTEAFVVEDEGLLLVRCRDCNADFALPNKYWFGCGNNIPQTIPIEYRFDGTEKKIIPLCERIRRSKAQTISLLENPGLRLVEALKEFWEVYGGKIKHGE